MIDSGKFEEILRRHHEARGPEELPCSLGSMMFARPCDRPAEGFIEVVHEQCDNCGDCHAVALSGCQECIDKFMEQSGMEWQSPTTVSIPMSAVRRAGMN